MADPRSAAQGGQRQHYPQQHAHAHVQQAHTGDSRSRSPTTSDRSNSYPLNRLPQPGPGPAYPPPAPEPNRGTYIRPSYSASHRYDPARPSQSPVESSLPVNLPPLPRTGSRVKMEDVDRRMDSNGEAWSHDNGQYARQGRRQQEDWYDRNARVS